MRARALIAVLVTVVTACGGHDKPPQAPEPTPDTAAEAAPPAPAPSEIQRRRDAACEALGPRLTACAIADARRTMPPDKVAELDLDKTAPVHTRKFIESCKQNELSSRQVRVYEVCLREETECAPLLACLDHAKPDADGASK